MTLVFNPTIDDQKKPSQFGDSLGFYLLRIAAILVQAKEAA